MTDDVVSWYSDHYDEDDRLDANSLEYIRCQEIITRCLSDTPMAIADVGGASGTYSFWLAGLGHNVHLIDLTSRHIAQAKAKAAQGGVPLAEYCCADARQLPMADDSFDLVLEMGPLYHLQNQDDRLATLHQAYRTLRPGGFVVCQVISRYASMMDGFKLQLIKDEYFQQIMVQDLSTGCHDNPRNVPHYFTSAYFHRPDDIREELALTGFVDIELIAVEGFASMLDADILMGDETMRPWLLDCLRQTEHTPELLGVSSHIMAIGRKPNAE